MNDALTGIAAIFWDFDGVIMASNAIRDQGFEEVLKEYPKVEVEQLMDFHRGNGGLSRYVKFRYFFEEVRQESISDKEVQEWAARFSVIMRELLANPALLIAETVNYIKQHHEAVPMYIVSGSDQAELRYLCQTLGIAPYFQRIHGSPTPKKAWVKTILEEEQLTPEHCLLVGDSHNDQEAALSNGLQFMGYNNPDLEVQSTWRLDLKG